MVYPQGTQNLTGVLVSRLQLLTLLAQQITVTSVLGRLRLGVKEALGVACLQSQHSRGWGRRIRLRLA